MDRLKWKGVAACGCTDDSICMEAVDLRDKFLRYRGGKKKKEARDAYSRHRMKVLNKYPAVYVSIWPL